MFSILGCGAIGSLIAWACEQNQLAYQIILRPQTLNTLSDVKTHLPITIQPYRLSSEVAHPIKFNAPIYTTKPQQNNKSPSLPLIDKLILPIKAYQVVAAIKQLQPQLDKHCLIVLMHNGLGTVEAVKKICPHADIISATTTHAAFQKSQFNTIQTGLGESIYGRLDSPLSTIPCSLKPLLTAFSPAKWDTEIKRKLWYKLAINCVINPLTAIHQIKNGELSNANWSNQITQLINEFCLVSKLEGVEFSQSELILAVNKVASATRDNWSSMNRDIQFNRPSEIDYITGYLLQKAAKHQLTLPHHQALFQQISLIQQAHKINI